jgi:hypothetical protein
MSRTEGDSQHVSRNETQSQRKVWSVKSDVWRNKSGILYADRHMPFQLDTDVFNTEPLPALPASEASRNVLDWAIKNGLPEEEIARLRKDLADAQALEQTGAYDCEEALYSLRRLIDRLLLCRRKNPAVLGALRDNLDYGLTQLYLAAKRERNKKAAGNLTWLLYVSVERLQEVALDQPQLFCSLAHALPAFPVMGSPFNEQQIENERLIKHVLHVGRDFWVRQHRKPKKSARGKSSRAKDIAVQLINYLQKYRIVYGPLSQVAPKLPGWSKRLRKLKRLSATTWRDWFNIAWEVVMETSGGEPAEVDAYREIVRRVRRKNVYGKLVDAARGAIKEALRDAFCELATGKHPRSSQSRS